MSYRSFSSIGSIHLISRPEKAGLILESFSCLLSQLSCRKSVKSQYVADLQFSLQGLAQQYQITAMPTLILIKGGQKVAQIVGANLPALKSEIGKHSSSPALAAA